MIEDFAAKRRIAIWAKQAIREIAKAESERDYQIDCAEQEFEDWLDRERIKREKYEQAMAEKRTPTAKGWLKL
jgi:hypothetical protein